VSVRLGLFWWFGGERGMEGGRKLGKYKMGGWVGRRVGVEG